MEWWAAKRPGVPMRHLQLVALMLLTVVSTAFGEADQFLVRDGNATPGGTYLDSDGAVEAKKPAPSPWETWIEGEAPPAAEFQLPGVWPIKQTAPELQTLVAGPTFRNTLTRIEVGAGFGYINSRWRFPFELSVEPTWRHNKNASSDEQNFARVRTFGLVEMLHRSSSWESTAFAYTGFYDVQNNSFNNVEFGGSITESIGRRLALTGNVVWSGFWPQSGAFENGAVGSVGVSYNIGAGVRGGGFYEPHNNVFHEDDFGGFLSWQFLPFAEFNINAGKNQFVLVRLMISYALERP
jgi:hypothetical protein